MKKYVSILCFLLVMMLSISACGTKPVSADTVNSAEKFTQAYGKIEASLPEMMEIPEESVLDFYGIEPSEYENALFRLSVDNMLCDEVIFVQAKDETSAGNIEEMLNARLQAKAEEAESYSPEQYEIIKTCHVYRDGLILALIVNSNANEMLDTFQQAMA